MEEQNLSESSGSFPQEEEELTQGHWLDEAAYGVRKVRRGDIITGTVVSVGSQEILVDIGCKTEGTIISREIESMGDEDMKDIKVGDKISVFVVKPEDEDGRILLSINRARAETDWQDAQNLYEAGEYLEAEISGYNKGGLIVNFGQVRGFVPGSQLETTHANAPQSEKHWENMIGKKLHLKIIEVDRSRNRLIFSERAAMQEWRKEQKERLLAELKEGDVRKGRVTSLANFGAFVDLGGADGLIHMSELSWSRISHPGEVLKVGDKIDVHILSIDRERQRIGLSLKRLMPEPWSNVLEDYAVGQVVKGVITKLTDFGAFARVGDSIEGLIHLSELSDANIKHPREVVKEGQEIEVRIIRIEPERKRMGLSLKQAEGATDWQEFSEEEEEEEVDIPEEVVEESQEEQEQEAEA